LRAQHFGLARFCAKRGEGDRNKILFPSSSYGYRCMPWGKEGGGKRKPLLSTSLCEKQQGEKREKRIKNLFLPLKKKERKKQLRSISFSRTSFLLPPDQERRRKGEKEKKEKRLL